MERPASRDLLIRKVVLSGISRLHPGRSSLQALTLRTLCTALAVCASSRSHHGMVHAVGTSSVSECSCTLPPDDMSYV